MSKNKNSDKSSEDKILLRVAVIFTIMIVIIASYNILHDAGQKIAEAKNTKIVEEVEDKEEWTLIKDCSDELEHVFIYRHNPSGYMYFYNDFTYDLVPMVSSSNSGFCSYDEYYRSCISYKKGTIGYDGYE